MAAIDGNFVTALSSDVMNSGAGVGLRLGLQRDLYPALLIPEAVFEHDVLDTHTPDNAALTRVLAGGRLRVLSVVQPGLFVHMGIGRIADGRSRATTDLTFDFGATVDVSVFSWVDLGLHAALNRVFGGDAGGLTFASIGLHAALVLEDKL